MPAGELDAAAVQLSDDPAVSYAEPDYEYPLQTVPDDPLWSSQTDLTSIHAPEAWDVTTGDSNVVVAVLDSGADLTHPDLAPNIWTNGGEISGNGIDDENDGFVDDVHGWDFYYGDASPMDDDSGGGHGTHVAGTIGARGNDATGVAGVSWNVKLLPLKVCAATTCSTSAAVDALNYATAHGARIANASWGGGTFSQALHDAIAAAGQQELLFVAAAGNDSWDDDAAPFYPASDPAPNVVSVAATDSNGVLAAFSNYGETSVDLASPGVDVTSSIPGNWTQMSGTSMAAPHVSGAAALILSMHPDWSAAEVKARLLATTIPSPALAEKIVTGGILDLAAAVGIGPTLTVTAFGEGNGTVASSPDGISCDSGSVCSYGFTAGESVQLTANPDANSIFVRWLGACAGSNSTCTVSASEGTHIGALFSTYSVTVTSGGIGTGVVTSSPAGISCGATCASSFAPGADVQLSANPDPGSVFSGWKSQCAGTGVCALTMSGARTKTATAFFNPEDAFAPWSFPRALMPPNGDDLHQLGIVTPYRSLALSENGKVLVVGAYRVPESSCYWVDPSDPGAAYVFERGMHGWALVTTLHASDRGRCSRYGYAVSISEDGSRIAVGAPWAGTGEGAVYVYSRSGDTWAQEARIADPNPSMLASFGLDLSLSAAGDRLLIARNGENVYPTPQTGTAWLYEREPSGWAITTELPKPNDGQGERSCYACSVSLSPDGTAAVVGAGVAQTRGYTEGAAYVYREADGWTLGPRLLPSDGHDVGDFGIVFGVDVACSDGCAVVAVGAYLDRDWDGSAYLYSSDGSGAWVETQKLAPSGGDWFGEGIAITPDGTTIVASSPFEDVGAMVDAGAMHVYRRDAGTWTQESRLFSPTGLTANFFGYGPGTGVGISADGLLAASTEPGNHEIKPSLAHVFTAAPAPVLDSFFPEQGDPGTTITISGQHLDLTSDVELNGKSIPFTADSATQLTATVPSGSSSGPISLLTPGGSAATTSDYFVPAPTIDSFAPASAAAGKQVVITGAHFADAVAVRFAGAPAPYTINSPNQITATVPDTSGGRIAVVAPSGSTLSTDRFKRLWRPHISSFSPHTGSVGSKVVIRGKHFSLVTRVQFGDIRARFRIASSRRVVTWVPRNAKTRPLRLWAGSLGASSQERFRPQG